MRRPTFRDFAWSTAEITIMVVISGVVFALLARKAGWL